ncbi:MAG: NAD(P)/FAD-dependent oxidoreductase, partial [Bacteriovoracaceae bacterium]|nr:NAD(P)/FAD-dependent oxidoreductase [Bacteriovoracaceae bacterium]
IGGHRFFSKSSKIMNWWKEILPISRDPKTNDEVLLVRTRVSRILFLGKFFSYPLSLTLSTLRNLGLFRLIKITISYIKSLVFKIKPENSLEDFFINRFGKELYSTFFRDYTEKVWGVPCDKISSKWGAQRIKGLSIITAIVHTIKKPFIRKMNVEQKNIETSLIEYFLYPKFGPGQLWEKVASIILDHGGKIIHKHQVTGVNVNSKQVSSILHKNLLTNKIEEIPCDYFISTMPVKDLIRAFKGDVVPNNVSSIAAGLKYRDFITVGLLLKQMKIKNQTKIPTVNNLIPDNWLYIQEPHVKLGRIQIFNNWSPFLVKNQDNVWIGLEYFCNEGDVLWSKSDKEMIDLGIEELEKINLIEADKVLDSTVIKTLKAYPAYFGDYNSFSVIRSFVDDISNLFLIGRNGMHRYNNQDHSMLAAMETVRLVKNNITSKSSIWNVNIEEEYLEEK